MATLPIPPAPTAPAMAVSPTSEIKVTVVTPIKSGRPSSKPEPSWHDISFYQNKSLIVFLGRLILTSVASTITVSSALR